MTLAENRPKLNEFTYEMTLAQQPCNASTCVAPSINCEYEMAYIIKYNGGKMRRQSARLRRIITFYGMARYGGYGADSHDISAGAMAS